MAIRHVLPPSRPPIDKEVNRRRSMYRGAIIATVPTERASDPSIRRIVDADDGIARRFLGVVVVTEKIIGSRKPLPRPGTYCRFRS